MVVMPQVEYQVDKTCSPTKVTLTFKGTCNCPLGHAIDPSVTMVAKKFRIMHEKKMEEEKEEAHARKKKKELERQRREEFLEKGRYMTLYGLLERKVQCASMCTDHLLNQRRDRLRELLLSEEENYAKEYITMCQAASEAKEEELKEKACQIKARQEQERRELAAKKIRELKIQDCEPARPYRAKKALEMVKQDQLWQIKEKYALQEAKREEERMYHDLMMKNLIDMEKRDEEDAKIQWLKQKEAKEMFIEQMKWKEMKEQKIKELKEFEKRQIEEEMKNYKEDGEKELEERRKRNAERIAEYREYLAREKEIKQRRQREEEEIDKAFSRLMQIEEEREKQKISNGKAKLKKQMDDYLESCREIQRLKDIEERKSNELVEELSAKIRAQQDANRIRLRTAKQDLFQNVMKERAEQVKEKRERERLEEEARNREIELLNLRIEQQRKIREEYERKCTEKRQEYGRQLKEQMKECEEAKKRKKLEDEEYARQVRLEEELKRRETEDILNNSCKLPMHPMKEFIVTHPPRFDKCLPCPRSKDSLKCLRLPSKFLRVCLRLSPGIIPVPTTKNILLPRISKFRDSSRIPVIAARDPVRQAEKAHRAKSIDSIKGKMPEEDSLYILQSAFPY